MNWRIRRTIKLVTKDTVIHLILLAGSIIFIFPLLWLVSTSLKYPKEMFPPIVQLIPERVKWANYPDMFKYFDYFKYFYNTMSIVVLNIMGVILTAPLVAYSFARLKWPGRDFLFMILLGTMMIPADITRIPIYIIYSKINWTDTWMPLWVSSWFGGGAFNIFLIRQFFMTIPKELEESGLVDGASIFRIYRVIMLPTVIPVLITVSIFVFTGTYNDFMGPLIYLSTTSKYTLAIALRMFQQDMQAGGTTQYGLMFAATVLMTLPLIIFFFIGQRYFIEGVVLTGIKG